VGASLLAMAAAAHSTSLWLTHRFREQAHSYRGFVVFPRILCTAEKPVGASLLAKTAAHTTPMCLTHRFREQARSHRGLMF